MGPSGAELFVFLTDLTNVVCVCWGLRTCSYVYIIFDLISHNVVDALSPVTWQSPSDVIKTLPWLRIQCESQVVNSFGVNADNKDEHEEMK